jgi:hypothetical protein
MADGEQVPLQPSTSVDVGRRPNTPDQIGEDVSTHQLKGKTRRNGTLSDEANEIGDLRISKPQTAHVAGFGTQVNAVWARDQIAEGVECRDFLGRTKTAIDGVAACTGRHTKPRRRRGDLPGNSISQTWAGFASKISSVQTVQKDCRKPWSRRHTSIRQPSDREAGRNWL